MSMLAERRRKQRFSPNPCGKLWSEDSSKFGQKMLEKMGWSKGKGLGINEQGITQHINVLQKNDKSGLGYNESEAWTIYEKKYDELLQQLGTRMSDTVENLESKYNSSSNEHLENFTAKQRNRYQKVQTCKDISTYKSKDLANIFGQKEWISEDQSKIKKEDINDIKDNNNGFITSNGGSSINYFKHKLKSKSDANSLIIDSLKSKSNESEKCSIRTPDNEESEDKQRVGFGFPVNKKNAIKENVLSFNCEVSNNFGEKSNYAFDNPCLTLNSPSSPDTSKTNSITKRSSKKRKKCENDSLHIDENEKCAEKKSKKGSNSKDGFTNLGLDLDVKSEESCNGKEFEVSRAQFGLENHGLDLTDECAKKHVTFDNRISVVEYCISPKKNLRKVCKRTKNKGLGPLRLKTKKRWTWVSATTIPLSGVPENKLSLSYVIEKKKKRKISNIVSNLETIQESPEHEKEVPKIETKMKVNLNANVIETSIANKNSKKKKKQKIIGTVTTKVSNKIPNDITETKEDENVKPEKQRRKEIESSIERKKKKKKKNKNICNIETEISNNKEDNKILNEMSLKQEENVCLSENENDTAKVQVLSVTGKKKEKEPSENIKPKKKKKKLVIKDEKIASNTHEETIPDKENTGKEEIPNTKQLEKKKQNKEIKDIEVTDTTTINTQQKTENMEDNDIYLSWDEDTMDSIDSSRNRKRMSKKLLIALYHNKAILDFPGSNIHAIEGYGVNIY